MTDKIKIALHNIKTMNAEQLKNAITKIDDAIVTLKSQMKNMGTQYKLKVAIPTLRDYDTIRKRLVTERDTRHKHERA